MTKLNLFKAVKSIQATAEIHPDDFFLPLKTMGINF